MKTFIPSSERGSTAAGVVAAIAGVAGLALLVLGAVRLIDSIDTSRSSTSAATFLTTTTTTTASTSTSTTEATNSSTSSSVPVAGGFRTLSDDSGSLEVSLPDEWTDTSGLAWSVEGEVVGLSVAAATDRDAWYSGWGTPGAFVGVTTVAADAYSPELGEFGEACSFADVPSLEYDGYFTIIQQWNECGDEDSDFTTALIWPDDFAYAALIQIVTLERDGLEVLDQIITTLRYSP